MKLTKDENADIDEILEAIDRYENKKGVSYKELNELCLDNLPTVAAMAFNESISTEIRAMLLFLWSTDHGGSCEARLNPRWANMMRTLVIPHMDKLPNDPDDQIRLTIEWWQSVHGL